MEPGWGEPLAALLRVPKTCSPTCPESPGPGTCCAPPHPLSPWLWARQPGPLFPAKHLLHPLASPWGALKP